MDDTTAAPGPANPPTGEVARRHRLEESRATMDSLRQDTARVSVAVAATERAVAGTLRKLAAEDRQRGRTAAADRREARAQEAERFAIRESAAAEGLTDRSGPDTERRRQRRSGRRAHARVRATVNASLGGARVDTGSRAHRSTGGAASS
jgi:hypothetical protein